MGAVSEREALIYGFRLFIWILLIGIVGAAISGVGFLIAGGGSGIVGKFAGGLLFLIGGLVIVSGLFGILYKVIRDAVANAND